MPRTFTGLRRPLLTTPEAVDPGRNQGAVLKMRGRFVFEELLFVAASECFGQSIIILCISRIVEKVGAGSERDPAATQPGVIYSPVRTPPIPATNPPFPSARPPVFVSIANLFKNGHASEHPPKFNA